MIQKTLPIFGGGGLWNKRYEADIQNKHSKCEKFGGNIGHLKKPKIRKMLEKGLYRNQDYKFHAGP